MLTEEDISNNIVEPINPDNLGGSIEKDFIPFIISIKKFHFHYIGHGSFRSVFKRKNIVIKIPRNIDGLIDNRVEARAWHKYKSNPSSKGIILAPCRLLPNNCLMMVNVNPHWENNLAPAWASEVEASQIGFRNNLPLAYDYALDVLEREEWEKEWSVASDYFYRSGRADKYFERLNKLCANV